MTQIVQYTDPWERIKDQAAFIARSGLAPDALRSPEAIAVVGLKGQELGIPMMMALNHVHVIQGKPTISAELMRALILRAGHRFTVIESTADKAVVGGQRWDNHTNEYNQQVTATFTLDDAQKAGIAGKGNWNKFPKAMLIARATSILARDHFADVLMGASYTSEEIDPDLEVDENGFAPPTVKVESVERDVPSRQEPDLPPATNPTNAPTAGQFAQFHIVMNENDVDDATYRRAMQRAFGVESISEITYSQMEGVIARVKTGVGLKAFIALGAEEEPGAAE